MPFAGEIKEVRAFVPGFSSGDRTRTFLKVQDGCNYFCAFCTIPLARGRSRSANVVQTVTEAQKAVAAGAKEIVLTGVNIGDFGTAHGETLLDLVCELDRLEGVERFRISSIEPNLLTDELIDFVADVPEISTALPHPAAIRPRRGVVRHAQTLPHRPLPFPRRAHPGSRMPHASIGVDVIVGFPGESKEKFLASVDFIKSLEINYLHVFTYSERPNTTALRIDEVVPVPERKERNKTLRNVSLKAQRAHYEAFLGQEVDVLFEEAEEDGLRMGYSPNYIRVAVPSDKVQGNDIHAVKLDRIDPLGWVHGTLV